MTIREMHLRIEQGLQKIGIFAYGDDHPEEIDIAINATIDRLLRNLFRDNDLIANANNFESNQYHTDFTRLLKEYECISPIEVDGKTIVEFPDDYRHLVSYEALVVDTTCKTTEINGDDSELVTDTSAIYQVIEDTFYDGVWYRKCDTFSPNGEDTNFFGVVSKLPTSTIEGRPYRTSEIRSVLNNSLLKPSKSHVVGDIFKDSLRIYSDSSTIVGKICIDYVRRYNEVDIVNNVGLDGEFDNGVQQYIIEQTIQHISILKEDNQQKIVNLKSQNIENV